MKKKQIKQHIRNTLKKVEKSITCLRLYIPYWSARAHLVYTRKSSVDVGCDFFLNFINAFFIRFMTSYFGKEKTTTKNEFFIYFSC